MPYREMLHTILTICSLIRQFFFFPIIRARYVLIARCRSISRGSQWFSTEYGRMGNVRCRTLPEKKSAGSGVRCPVGAACPGGSYITWGTVTSCLQPGATTVRISVLSIRNASGCGIRSRFTHPCHNPAPGGARPRTFIEVAEPHDAGRDVGGFVAGLCGRVRCGGHGNSTSCD
jgi:hypothetical protein